MPNSGSNTATCAAAVSRKKSASWPNNVNAKHHLIHQYVYADKHMYTLSSNYGFTVALL